MFVVESCIYYRIIHAPPVFKKMPASWFQYNEIYTNPIFPKYDIKDMILYTGTLQKYYIQTTYSECHLT